MQIKYVFYSLRLGFRKWTKADIPTYQMLSSDPRVMEYFPKGFWLDYEGAAQAAERYNQHFEEEGYTYFAVDLLETSEFIGFIGLKKISYDIFFAPAIDVGWRLAYRFWGKGYATEGAQRCLSWFFDHFKGHKVVSLTTTENKASINVMKKIGMKKVGVFDHPLVARESRHCRHVLYEIQK